MIQKEDNTLELDVVNDQLNRLKMKYSKDELAEAMDKIISLLP